MRTLLIGALASLAVACNEAPTITHVEITPGTPGTHHLVQAKAEASDSDNDKVDYQYQWFRNGKEIPGATSHALDLYDPGNGDTGDRIAVQVMASDGRKRSSARMSPEVTIQEAVTSVVKSDSRSYPVRGRTTAEVFDSIERNGLAQDDDSWVFGVTNRRFAAPCGSVQTRLRGNECIVESVALELQVTITLPERTPPELDPGLRQRWDRFWNAVNVHEARHAAIAKSGLDKMRERIENIPPQRTCSAVREEVRRVWERELIGEIAAQSAFHRDEAGRIAAQCRQPEMERDRTRSRLTSLQGQVAGVDASLSALLRDIQFWEALYGSRMPAAVYSTYSTSVSRYNSLVAQRNVLATEHNAVGADLRRANEELLWCRAS